MRFLSVLILALCASNTQAAITIRADSAIYGPGATLGILDVFISSNTGTDLTFALSTDFELIDGGDFTVPPGVFGQTDFFGEGLLNVDGSFFQRADTGVANLSLEFDTIASPPTGEILLAQLSIDLAGLTPGVYQVAITNPFVVDGSASDIPTSVFNGSFEVTAVPEPTTTTILGLGAVAFGVRRIRRAQKSLAI